MKERLNEIQLRRGNNDSFNVVRDAIGAYIDQQEDAISSKAHFSRSLQGRMDALETILLAQIAKLELRLDQPIKLLDSKAEQNPTSSPQLHPNLVELQFLTLLELTATSFSKILAAFPDRTQTTDSTHLIQKAMLSVRQNTSGHVRDFTALFDKIPPEQT